VILCINISTLLQIIVTPHSITPLSYFFAYNENLIRKKKISENEISHNVRDIRIIVQNERF
jgi:formate dehydrogenase assembly factor FdhD